jgi:DmsE family decaheme c-type cytochrome
MPNSTVSSPSSRHRDLLSKGGPWLAIAVAALVTHGLAAAQQPAALKATTATTATTVGSATCQACHEDVFKAFQTNPHAAVDKDAKRGWQGKACESCHGPGSVHAGSGDKKDIRNPLNLAVREADKLCLSCHLNQPTQVGRIQSSHARDQVSCVACHSVHKAEGGQMVARTASAVNQQCSSCHPQIWVQFMRPYAHKLPQGAMSCVDCHNPHGSLLAKSVRTVAANEPGCLKCHGDKRGPFVYEHAPVRLEGCVTCHQPHGSANPRMLTRQEIRFVCLECHFNKPAASVATLPPTLGGVPPALHDLRNPRFNNCTICHVKIHGSNVDRALMR